MNEDFTVYRNKKGYSPKSIQVQNSHIARFSSWCAAQGISPTSISYQQVLAFIESERRRGMLTQSIVREVNSIRIYFDYLIQREQVSYNVISRVRMIQPPGKLLPNPLSAKQLEAIYRDYASLPEWKHASKRSKQLHVRNLALLGLVIYQGATSGEIAKLERSHMNLTKGKVYIPCTRKSNPRLLALDATQVVAIQTYIQQPRPAASPPLDPYLIPGTKHSDMIAAIIRQVRTMHPEITNARQVRASVIVNWLKTNNIRQVQYMAGHKSIKSTEQYRSQDLSNLTRQLELFHPLG